MGENDNIREYFLNRLRSCDDEIHEIKNRISDLEAKCRIYEWIIIVLLAADIASFLQKT